jgi:outer membrane protein
MKMRKILLCFVSTAMAFSAYSQEKWDLKRAVEYAIANNISVKQADVQARIAAVQYKQTRLSMIPSLNMGGNLSYGSGLNQDPVTFRLITQGFVSNGYNLQTQVDLFNFFNKQNTIEANKYENDAANANVDRVRNDVSLNVANAYLNVLLAREQVNISRIQVQQTLAQLSNTRKLVNAGSLPELEAANLEAQLARDSATLVQTDVNATTNLLTLKALLNIDMAAEFDVTTPPIDQIPMESLAELQPDLVYRVALDKQPLQQVNALRVKSYEHFVKAQRGAMFPRVSLFGNLGTNATDQGQRIVGTSTANPPIGKVNISGTDYSVYSNEPFTVPLTAKDPYFSQLNRNFSQSIGLNLSIPIFNAWQARAGYARTKLNLENFKLQSDQDNITLKQNIYQSYAGVIAALQKFNANRSTVINAERAYEFAGKRFAQGLLNTFDLITSQNNLTRAKLDEVLTHYDFVFRMKVLEFYKGEGIKLQ